MEVYLLAVKTKWPRAPTVLRAPCFFVCIFDCTPSFIALSFYLLRKYIMLCIEDAKPLVHKQHTQHIQ